MLGSVCLKVVKANANFQQRIRGRIHYVGKDTLCSASADAIGVLDHSRVVDVFAMPQSGTGVVCLCHSIHLCITVDNGIQSVEAVDPVYQVRLRLFITQVGVEQRHCLDRPK